MSKIPLKMKNIYIHQHSRLGDMILCNGLIRILSKKYKNKVINIFCRSKLINLIQYMYRDNKRIKLIPLEENFKLTNVKLINCYEKKFIHDFFQKNKIKKEQCITIGFENYQKTKDLNPDKKRPWPCDIVFYKQFNIPFYKRFTETFWKRNKQNEKKLYNKLIKKDEKFIFIHDDPKNNLHLSNKFLINKNIKIVRNDINENIFDYGLILEKATEIHIMESSIRQIIEVLNIKTKKLFLYKGRGGEHDINLYNDKLNKFIGTRRKWKVIKRGIISKKPKKYILDKLNSLNQKLIYYNSIKKFSND